MDSVTGLGQTRSAGLADVRWSEPLSQQADPMVPWSVPSLLVGFYVMQGVLAGSKMSSDDKQSTPISRVPAIRNHLMASLHHVKERRMDIKHFWPRKKNLNTSRLTRKMGKDFDNFWMSQKPPGDFIQILTKRNVDTALFAEMSTLDLPTTAQDLFAILELSTQNGNESNATSTTADVHDSGRIMTKVVNKLESWLVQLASCPVYYKWEDLGLIYWPRWIRKGMCSRQDEGNPLYPSTDSSSSSSPPFSTSSSFTSSMPSCSWPPGMHCVPSKEKKLKVLRWTCRNVNRYRHNGRKKEVNSSPHKIDSPHHEVSADEEEPEHQHERGEYQGEFHDEGDNKPEASKQLRQMFMKYNYNNHTESAHHGKARNSMRNIASKNTDRGESGEDFISRIRSTVQARPAKSLQQIRRSLESQSHQQRIKRDMSAGGGHKGRRSGKAKRKGRRRKTGIRCRWVKIIHPVIDDCYCSC